MKLIFKYLKPFIFMALAAIALLFCQRTRALRKLCTALDGIHIARAARRKPALIEQKTEVGLARAAVRQRQLVAVRLQLIQHGADELQQMLHLLQLAARVLIDAPLAREDVLRLQERHGMLRVECLLRRRFLPVYLRGCQHSLRGVRSLFLHAVRSTVTGGMREE